MRILVVVHQFLPRYSTGTEVYTYKLAKALQVRGHDVRIFCTYRDAERPQFEFGRTEYDELPVYEVVHNHRFADFRAVYVIPEMEAHLRTVLEEFPPDVVHVQHLYTHSLGYFELFAQRGIPVLFTLAEYFVICLRSWLLKPDHSLCPGPDFDECAICALRWPSPPRTSWLARRLAPRPDAPPPRLSLRRFLDKLRRRMSHADDRAAVERRWHEHAEALRHVDLFVAPSRFLREQFVRSGMIEPERIEYSDYGFDHAPFAHCTPRTGTRRPLVVGFIGSIAEQKGVDVLVEACRKLSPTDVELHVHGDLDSFPRYAKQVRSMPLHAGIRFFGRYDNTRVGEILSSFDVVVVPSLWYENSPLTIHEAFMAGVPVVTGDQGGMAELVEHEKSGLQFTIGDADDLRRQLQRLLDEPDLLPRLRAGIPSVKSIAEDAEETESRFARLLRREPTRH